MNPSRKILSYALISLALANIGIWQGVASTLGVLKTSAEIHFLDVGQGDASLIRARAGNVLIDGGRGAMSAVRSIDEILPVSDRIIDILVVGHPQIDHLGGFVEVLRRYDVRLVLFSGADYPLKAYQTFLATVKAKKIPMLYALRGEEIFMGSGKFRVLAPDTLLAGVSVSEKIVNDTSVVMRFDAGGAAALFTGDISSGAERRISTLAGDIDILKVSHHGSKYSSDASFLRAITPQIAVIGVGKNSYGHPAPETLSRLTAVGAQIFRTDRHGTVSLIVDNGVVKIKTDR